MIRLFGFSLVFALGIQCLPSQAQETTHVGSNKGRFTVSAAGEASFQIPIPVPPGIQDQQPKLNFSYSSSAPNGLLGVGWSMSGFPKVSRAKKIIAIDGLAGSIEFTNSDRFALSGQRLLVMTGENGDENSTYRTEIDTWRKITTAGSAGTGPERFKVIRPDGTHMIFGGAADARPTTADGATAREWLLSQVTDRNGNTLSIRYSQSPNGQGTEASQSYPVEIAYGTNVDGPATPDRFVKFEYETRPDPYRHFLAGTEVTTDLRLTKVSTFLGPDLVAQYRLSYEISAANGRSRLTTVQRFASDAANAEGLAPTAIAYSDGNNAFDGGNIWIATAFTSGSGWDRAQNPVTMADVNGDGLSDIVGFKDGTQVSLATQGSYASPTVWISDFSPGFNWTPDQPRYLSDINGDGLADIVGFSNDGVVTALADAKSQKFLRQQGVFPHFSANTGWTQGAPRYLADVNGDGAVDIVGMDDGATVALANETGGFNAPKTWNANFGVRQGFAAENLLLADMNGDGKSDVVAMDQRSQTISVALSNGSAFDTTDWAQNYQNFANDGDWGPDNPRMFSDVNGDGLTDIVGFSTTVLVGLSNGAGFEPPETWSNEFGAPNWDSSTPRMLMDVNADGLADIVGIGDSSVQIALSNGAAFAKSNWNQSSLDRLGIGSGGSAADVARLPVDVNADGLTDLVGFTASGVVVGLVAGAYPDLMTSLTRSTRGQVTVNYKPISNPSVYSETPGEGALAKFQRYRPINQNSTLPVYRSAARLTGHFYVVADNTSTNNAAITGRDFSYPVKHFYKDGATSNLGRGWLGFGSSTHTNVSMSRTTALTYNQQFPLIGRPSEKSLSCMTDATVCTPGEIYHEDFFDYEEPVTETSTTTGFKARMVQVKAIRSDRFQGNDYKHSLGQSFVHDKYGNQTQTANLNLVDRKGKDIDPSDNVYKSASFSDDEANWFLSYPLYRKVSASSATTDIGTFVAGTDVSLKQYSYGPEMNLIGANVWDQQNGVFVGDGYSFDAFGNRLSHTASNGAVTNFTVEDTWNTYEIGQTMPANADGERLTELYGFDARFGKRSIRVDSNGNVDTVCYDDFGRRATLQGPLPADADQALTAASCVGSFVVQPSAVPSQKLVNLVTFAHAWENGIATVRRTTLQDWALADGNPQTLLNVTYYDGMDRDYRRVTQAEDGSLTRVVKDETFNAMHDVVESLLPHFTTDSAPASISQSFDPLDRSIGNTAPWTSGGATKTVLAKIVHTVTDTGEQSARTEAAGTPYEVLVTQDQSYFNNDARSVTVTVQDVGQGGTALHTQLNRDLTGRITVLNPPGATGSQAIVPTCASAPDGAGPNTDIRAYYAYDSLNRVCAKRLPALGTIQYAFGTDGFLSSKKTNTGTTSYGYDALGRQLNVTYPGGPNVALTYDNPQAGENGRGRLTSAKVSGQAQDVTRSFGYDAYGNAKRATLAVGGQAALDVVTRFDPVGRPVHQTLPDNTIFEWGFAYGNLISQKVNGTQKIGAADFTAFGQPQTMSFGNGVETQQTYGAAFHMQSIKTGLGPTTIFAEKYARDPFGFVLSVTGASAKWSSYSRTMSYESQRLVTASDSRITQAQSLAYDDAGNLFDLGPLKTTPEGFQLGANSTYDGAPLAATYDLSGNLTDLGSQALSFSGQYDGRDRLIETTVTAGTSRYAYDHTGQRVWRQGADGTEYIYVTPGYVAKDGTTGSQAQVTVHGPMGPAWMGTFTGGAVQSETWLHSDERRSVVFDTDAKGTAGAFYLYDAYGAVDANGSTGTPTFGFLGQRLDADTGLNVYGARYYDPRLGRFTRADTQYGASPDRPDAANRYAFLLNNPQFGFDPSGHAGASCALPVTVGTIGGIGGLGAGGANIYLGVSSGNTVQAAAVGGGAAAAGLASIAGAAIACVRNVQLQGQLRRIGRLERRFDQMDNRMDDAELRADNMQDETTRLIDHVCQ